MGRIKAGKLIVASLIAARVSPSQPRRRAGCRVRRSSERSPANVSGGVQGQAAAGEA